MLLAAFASSFLPGAPGAPAAQPLPAASLASAFACACASLEPHNRPRGGGCQVGIQTGRQTDKDKFKASSRGRGRDWDRDTDDIASSVIKPVAARNDLVLPIES